MSNLKVVLLSLAVLLGFNTQAAELTQYVTPKNVAAGLATAGTIYATYKVYKARCAKKAKQAVELQYGLAINNAHINGGDIFCAYESKKDGIKSVKTLNQKIQKFEISNDTVFAFDLHDVVAKYDAFRMAKKGILHLLPYLLPLPIALKYPKMTTAGYAAFISMLAIFIAKEVKNGASAQEIFENLSEKYPNFRVIFEFMGKQAIDVSAQLRGIQGTIDIAKKLMDNGYTVVFVSNIEPALWDRFVEDFPQFKDCAHILPTPENDWIKKPSEEYFTMARRELVEHLVVNKKINLTDAHKDLYINDPKTYKLKVLFIDDRLKNVAPALIYGIPSLVYFSANQLERDLVAMGANLD